MIIALVLLGIGCASSPNEYDSDNKIDQTNDNQGSTNENVKNEESSYGTPEQAPQLSIRASFDSLKGNRIIKLEHQWGDTIKFSKEETIVKVNENYIDFAIDGDEKFRKGDISYIYYNSDSNDFIMINPKKIESVAFNDNLASIPGKVDIKIIDKTTQQFIASMTIS